MASNPSAAAFLAHQLETYQRWRDPACLDLARDVLDDIGFGGDPGSIALVASNASRPSAFGLHRLISTNVARAFIRDHPEEGLTNGNWPAWRGSGGALRRCSCYLETSEHVLHLISRWLCGATVPPDIDVLCRFYSLSSRLAFRQIAASEETVQQMYRLLLEERGRQHRDP